MQVNVESTKVSCTLTREERLAWPCDSIVGPCPASVRDAISRCFFQTPQALGTLQNFVVLHKTARQALCSRSAMHKMGSEEREHSPEAEKRWCKAINVHA